MTATLTATGGGAYGFEGGFETILPAYGSVLNPSPFQLDSAQFATDNAGIPGITVDTTTIPGSVLVYVESDGQTLKIPQGVTTIKFTLKAANTEALVIPTFTPMAPLAINGSYAWTLLTNPLTRVRATDSGLKTLNFNSTNIIAASKLGYAVYDASAEGLDGLTIAYAANTAFTMDKTQAAAGDTVTATATVNSTIDAYGFTGVLSYTAANLKLDTVATAAANPALTLTFTGSNGANRITCQSTSTVITANTPLALVLKFQVTNTTISNLTVNFGSTVAQNRLVLFKTTSEKPADVATPTTMTSEEAAGNIAIVLSTASPVLTTIQAATVTLAQRALAAGRVRRARPKRRRRRRRPRRGARAPPARLPCRARAP